MFATQKGRSKPERISSKRWEKLKRFSCCVSVARSPSPSPTIDIKRNDQQPRRSRIFSADKPATQITLIRLARPAAIVTDERDTFKSFAKKSMQAWLALPSAGGAMRDSFRASPSSPVRAFFFARGWTLTAKLTPVGEF